MEKTMVKAWLHMYGDARTKSIIEGKTQRQPGDVGFVSPSIITDGSLVLWDPSRVASYKNTFPGTKDRVPDFEKPVAPVIRAAYYELPAPVTDRMRTRFGHKFIIALGNGYAAYTSTDPDTAFAIEDGAQAGDEFLDGYEGKPAARGFMSDTTARIMRRFAVTRVEMCPRAENGLGVLKFSGTFKGKPIVAFLLNAVLDPGDEDHALDLVREWAR